MSMGVILRAADEAAKAAAEDQKTCDVVTSVTPFVIDAATSVLTGNPIAGKVAGNAAKAVAAVNPKGFTEVVYGFGLPALAVALSPILLPGLLIYAAVKTLDGE